MLNKQKDVWYQLKPIPDNMKVSNVVHSGTGKFYMFLTDTHRKQDFPTVFTYDLKIMCPRLDRYWQHLRASQKEESQREERSKLEFFAREDSLAEPGLCRLQDPFKPTKDPYESVIIQEQAKAQTEAAEAAAAAFSENRPKLSAPALKESISGGS